MPSWFRRAMDRATHKLSSYSSDSSLCNFDQNELTNLPDWLLDEAEKVYFSPLASEVATDPHDAEDFNFWVVPEPYRSLPSHKSLIEGGSSRSDTHRYKYPQLMTHNLLYDDQNVVTAMSLDGMSDAPTYIRYDAGLEDTDIGVPLLTCSIKFLDPRASARSSLLVKSSTGLVRCSAAWARQAAQQQVERSLKVTEVGHDTADSCCSDPATLDVRFVGFKCPSTDEQQILRAVGPAEEKRRASEESGSLTGELGCEMYFPACSGSLWSMGSTLTVDAAARAEAGVLADVNEACEGAVAYAMESFWLVVNTLTYILVLLMLLLFNRDLMLVFACCTTVLALLTVGFSRKLVQYSVAAMQLDENSGKITGSLHLHPPEEHPPLLTRY